MKVALEINGLKKLVLIRRNRLQNLLLTLNEFERINKLLLPPKTSENRRFFDDFRGERS